MRVLVHKSAFWVVLKGQNTKKKRFFAFLVTQGPTILVDIFFFSLCEKIPKNHGYKNAKEKSIFIFWAEKCVLGAHRWSKHQNFCVFGIFGHPRTHYQGWIFFAWDLPLPEIEEKKIMKEIAKKKSKLWAPVLHMAVPDRQNTRLLRFFALFGTQKPCSGVKIFPEKKNFFFRDFSKIDLSLVKTMKFRVRKTTF